MLKIWQEQITLLGIIDTSALLASPKAFPVRTDGRLWKKTRTSLTRKINKCCPRN